MCAELKSNVSYFAKDATVCPVCEAEIFQEKMRTGGGRLNAGKLTDELHRMYIPTKNYGEIIPLLYSVQVCPKCLTAIYPRDISFLKGNVIKRLQKEEFERKNELGRIFPETDFTRHRTLVDGAASYYLAMRTYEYLDKNTCPVFKQGLSALRVAWLCNYLQKKKPGQKYNALAHVHYRKAAYFYNYVIELDSKGEQGLTNAGPLGPDQDHNYGYDGVLYLAGILQFKYGQTVDAEKRIVTLGKARSVVAKIVGMGKASKSKPSALLDMSRELHGSIKTELARLEGHDPDEDEED